MPDKHPAHSVLVRAQSWLGTFVEIRAEAAGRSRWLVAAALDAAFAEIGAIHRLMSRQERGTDAVKLACAAVGDVVSLDARTAQVLRLALALQEESAGKFCIEAAAVRTGSNGVEPAWEFVATDVIRIRRRASADLDGIAKGYAVDRAIEVLRIRGVDAIVNAGGDLRSSVASAGPLLVRCPWITAGLVEVGRMGVGAFATSQSSACPETLLEPAGSGVADRRHRATPLPALTVSVAAPTCAVADALTKVVAMDPQGAGAILARHDASAWVLQEFDGATHMLRLGSSSVVTRDAA